MSPENNPNQEHVIARTTGIGLKDLLIPISIAIAGAFIGIGLYFGGGQSGAEVALEGGTPTNNQPAEPADNTSKVNPVTESDWIKGSPEAPIKIVEFSDYDCPFCGRFHATMDEVVNESDGQVAWVYRHFPLEQLHPQAAAVASAAECVGSLGGNDAFWQFSDRYFEVRSNRDATPHAQLIPQLVTETGVNQADFTSCFENATYAEKIQAHMADAVETGGRGTPWSILIAPDGTTYPINGAQTKQSVEQLIDFVLQGS
jgi:protein-disulfide isomerase